MCEGQEMSNGLLKFLVSIPFWLIELALGYVEWSIINTVLAKLTLLLILAGLAIPIVMLFIFFIIVGIYGASS